MALLVHDDQQCKLIRSVLDPEWLDSSIQRRLTELAFAFIDTYSEAPKAHDEDLLTGFSSDQQELARVVIGYLRTQFGNGINVKYVLHNLEEWARAKRFNRALTDGLAYLQAGQIDEVETVLAQVLKQRFSVFQPGLFLSDFKHLDLDDNENDHVLMGIPALDETLQVPHRKELWQVVGPAKGGKSWCLIHIARQAIMQHFRTLYLTLEMSEPRVLQRIVQGLMAAVKRPYAELYGVELQTDALGRLMDMHRLPIEGKRPILNEINDLASERIDKLHIGHRLLIKEFPTKSLTIQRLRAYLDALEGSTNFIPDVIIIDYGDLMKLPAREASWTELGTLWGELRGVGVERNAMIVTASQLNREGAKSSIGKSTDVAGDWSKIATADVTVIYNQTASEHDLGVARLFVSDGRNDADKFEVLITQNYAIGQFVIDSVRVPFDYKDRLKDAHIQLEN